MKKTRRITMASVILILIFLIFFPGVVLEVICFLKNNYNILLTIITSLSNLALVIIGIFGFKSWKNQLRGKTEYSTARQYIKSVLQVENELKILRNPNILVGELLEAYKEKVDCVKIDFKSFDDYYITNKNDLCKHVYSSRWQKFQKNLVNLEAILLEAKITWGDIAIEVQDNLRSHIKDLEYKIKDFVNSPSNIGVSGKNDILRLKSRNDEFSKKINLEVKKIEDFLKDYL